MLMHPALWAQGDILQVLISCDLVEPATAPQGEVVQSALGGIGNIDNLEIKYMPGDGYQVTEYVRTSLSKRKTKTKRKRANVKLDKALIDELQHLVQSRMKLEPITAEREGMKFQHYGLPANLSESFFTFDSLWFATEYAKVQRKSNGMKGSREGCARYRKDLTIEALGRYPFQQHHNYHSFKLVLVSDFDTLYLVSRADQRTQQLWIEHDKFGEAIGPVLLPELDALLYQLLPRKFIGRENLAPKEIIAEYARAVKTQDETLSLDH